MPELIFNSQTWTSFTGTFLALISAGFLWLIKSAYEKHKQENLALAKFERMSAINLTTLKDNAGFIDQWASSAKNNRFFSYSFEKLLINEEETYKLSNLKLINKIISTNYMLNRMNNDPDNTHKNHWDVILKIDSMPDDKKEINLQSYNTTITSTLEQIKLSYPIAEKELIDLVAHIRALAKVRKHSLFGYLNLLFIDIFPRFNEKSLELETKKLKEEIAQKKLGQLNTK